MNQRLDLVLGPDLHLPSFQELCEGGDGDDLGVVGVDAGAVRKNASRRYGIEDLLLGVHHGSLHLCSTVPCE